MRWLHISDLHFRVDDAPPRQVTEALVHSFDDTLAELKPDAILCTGDVAYSGQEAEYRAAAAFFKSLRAATGVPDLQTRERVDTPCQP